MGLDEAVLRIVNGAATVPFVQMVAVGLSSPWMLLVAGAPVAVRFGLARRPWAILTVVVAVGSADVVVARALKPVFDRERPCRAIEGLVSAAPCGSGESFPSGHATTAFTFAAATGVLAAGAGPWLWILAGGVAGSRVVLGVHYPSDVLAGSLLGAALGLGMGVLGGRIEGRWSTEKARTPRFPRSSSRSPPTGPAAPPP